MELVSAFSDAQLVVAMARFREEALAEAYRRHGGAVYGLARRITGSTAEAEDVTQEVFIRLWQHPDRYDARRGALRTYLLAQAHGRAVDLVRARAARERREINDARRTATALYDLEREVWDLAVADQLSKAIGQLAAEERAAIELAYFGGHTYREVAVILEQPEGTVKSRIRRGLRQMKNALSELASREAQT